MLLMVYIDQLSNDQLDEDAKVNQVVIIDRRKAMLKIGYF